MSDTVFLRLDDHGDTLTTQWCVCSSEGALHSGSGSLTEAAQVLGVNSAIVLVPGTEVLLNHASIPDKQRRHLLKAVPYLLEDKLADDIETLHFAVGKRDESGDVRVAVTSQLKMQRWLEQLDDAEIGIRELVPDTLVVPYHEDAWTLLLGDKTAWLRQDQYHSYAVDIEQAAEFLTMALSQASEQPGAIQLLDNESISDFHKYEIKCICEETGVALREEQYGDLQEVFARQYAVETNAINLLQGAYSRKEKFERQWGPWRMVGLGILLLVALNLTNLVIEQYRLGKQQEALEKRIEGVYRATFPSAKKVVDPKLQMEQQLRLLRTGGQGQLFSVLFSKAAEPLRHISGIQFQLVNYRNGEMEIVVHAPSLQILDQYKQMLMKDKQLAVEISSANTSDKRVEGRLQIREAR